MSKQPTSPPDDLPTRIPPGKPPQPEPRLNG
ncbi:hypothetical protein SAMN06265355_104381 [Actinomadura mexicana]|uniref:Uncharacterized protein n=1 Tax=Actinomadura mexicana TaxID=134959 RepID=A0A238XIZ7_9ACTN|nr:hypothetical protein SAMN06265355_104381 [Actinomadura mexicana]